MSSLKWWDGVLFPILPACTYREAPQEWGWETLQWPPCQLKEGWRVCGGRFALRRKTQQQARSENYTGHWNIRNTAATHTITHASVHAGTHARTQQFTTTGQTAGIVVFVCVSWISEYTTYNPSLHSQHTLILFNLHPVTAHLASAGSMTTGVCVRLLCMCTLYVCV